MELLDQMREYRIQRQRLRDGTSDCIKRMMEDYRIMRADYDKVPLPQRLDEPEA